MKYLAILASLCLLAGCMARDPAPVIYHGASDGITKEIVRILKENPKFIQKVIPKKITRDAEPSFSKIVETYKWILPQGDSKPDKKTEPAVKPEQKTATQKPIVNKAEPVKLEKFKGFIRPVTGTLISSFGAKADGTRNDGVNIKTARGTEVKAAEGGEIVYADNGLTGYGNLILIRHPNEFVTAYAHLEDINFAKGDAVKRGSIIGRVGSTGNVATPQLHFEIRQGAKPIDPTGFIKF